MIDRSSLTRRRSAAGLSRSELAERVGVSARMILFYEDGTSTPTPARLERLAIALGCQVRALTGTQRGQETLIDLRYATGLTLERAAELLRSSPAGHALRVSASKLSALEKGAAVHGAGWSDPKATGTLLGPMAKTYRVPVRVVLDAWMRTRPADPVPVPAGQKTQRPDAAALVAWESLNERQQVYLGEIMRDDRMTETEMWMRRLRHLPVPRAAEWRRLPLALDAAASQVGYTRLQERLRRRGVHDPGAGRTVHALERRGMVRITRDTIEHSAGGSVGRVLVEITRRGRAVARAGLGEPREPDAPAHLLSEWLWGVLVRVASAGPEGLADDDLAGRSLFYIGVGYRGGANGPPSRGFVESHPVMAPGGTHVAEYRWRLTALGRAHVTECPDGRRDALAEAGVRLGADGVMVGAWCETEMPAADEDEGLTGGDDTDGKHQSKAVLAPLDVASQYLLGRDDAGPIKPKKGTDHPAEAALLDLYRSLGVIDDRVANALAPEKAGHAVDRIAHVGIHIRQQNNRPGEKGSPKVVVTASALVPPSPSCGTWTMLGWTSTRPLWQSYRAAQNSFHASAYPAATGERRSYRQKWDDAAEIVERAVADLAEELEGVPYVITVEETSARRCWDGIQNVRQGTSPADRNSKYWLPGHTLSPGDQPLAVIRVNIDGNEVPQPVGTSRHYRRPDAESKPGMTATGLFEIATDFDSPVWILCNVPRAFAGKGGRLGEHHTRWDAEPSVYSEDPAKRRKGEMGQNWYAMTATEIYPIARGADMSAEALAVATAKLCHQALTWSDRVRLPVPLHAAKQMDLDHPQYRRTAPSEEKLEAEPGAEDSGVDQQSSADDV
ncbi:RNaseH domain-containing protein [Catenulispora rubra]|uniref:RNaseH domain-containing protein n=1 Tax=Catenulispora rubra TaxID=280293 RepID=UPI001E56D8A9|nr:RNaseH domain-containing protein [Catenulispora rubra]